jgi:hypothetical protein
MKQVTLLAGAAALAAGVTMGVVLAQSAARADAIRRR